MMTGGMPLGVPPSVCLPADALCQQYVDSHGMKSQVAHIDIMRYSSEVPEPVESVRYFAPNTCTPVNARVFSEPALSYSEWAPSSNVKWANNFAIGRTVVDQLSGNLQPQQFRGGQAAGPRPPGSRNETTHASFDNEKRALVRDAEATNGERNVVATGEKCDQKVSSSKKSGKKRSADRSGKRSRSRPGRKQLDSDSESRSCDEGDKEQWGQSTSGTRPRQSRSKQRRASRSRSISFTGDKRRASSSTASRKRKSPRSFQK